MKTVKISGKNSHLEIIVDDKDFISVSSKRWYMAGKYPRTQIWVRGKTYSSSIHKFILGPKEGFQIDHINGNPLDNRRSNLRHCTFEENQRNRRKMKNNKSGFKGVYEYKKSKRWFACLDKNGKAYYGTLRNSPEEAHQDYEQLAKEHFGEFAKS